MANLDAQREATKRYNKKTYDRLELWVKKGQREVIQEFAKRQGKSTNRFVLDLIEEAMKQEGDA